MALTWAGSAEGNKMPVIFKRPIEAMRQWRKFKKTPGFQYNNFEKLNHGPTYPNYFDGWKKMSNAYFQRPAAKEYFFYVVRDTATRLDREYFWAKFQDNKEFTNEVGWYETKRWRETGAK